MAEADANIAHVFQNLALEMGKVSTALGAQGISQIIAPFEGDAKKFKDWVKSIEKYALLTDLDDDNVKRVAYQSSRGPVSDFIRRYQATNPGSTWNVFKRELANRFSEVVDEQHAFMLLRKVHQKQGESVQVYAEKLITLSEEAFPNQQGPEIQRQLIDIFVDGLSEDHLKMKILRENPNNLNAAITAATNEQNIRKRFSLRTRHPVYSEEERMEVDHYRPAPRCFKCHKGGHRAKDCKVRPQVNALENVTPNQGSFSQERLCWYCNRKGHLKRDCRKRQADLKSQKQGGGKTYQNSHNNQEN